MSAKKAQAKNVARSLTSFLGLSVVAGLLIGASTVPALAATRVVTESRVFSGTPDYLSIDTLAQPTTLLAKKGDTDVELTTFYAQNRIPIPFSKLSQAVKDATLSAEDPRFYEHGALDVRGTLRGILSTIIGKISGSGTVQGGSSITQQYVKNVLLQKCEAMAVKTDKQKQAYTECVDDSTGTTLDRKLREMRYAVGLEKKFSKDEILAGYLNIAGFGGSVYGIEAAARYYFNTSATDLTPSQAASLIAMVNEPNLLRLDMPHSTKNGADNGYAATKERRNYILAKMHESAKLTDAQYAEAIASPIEPTITPSNRGCQSAEGAAYFCDYIQHIVREDSTFGSDPDTRVANLNRGGYTIYTTLDLDLQTVANSTLDEWVPKDYSAHVGGALVGVQPGTGRVLYMAQNKDYTQDPDVVASDPVRYTGINFNTDFDEGGSSGFQPGSTYKVFTLAQWLNQGHSLSESVGATVQTYSTPSHWPFRNSCGSAGTGVWTPKNDDSSNPRSISALAATVSSVNTAFVGMAKQLDLCSITKNAEAFGVHSATPGKPLGSTAASILGTTEVAPLTMATAFAGIANHGTVCTPIAIDKIIGADGKERSVPQSRCSHAVTEKVAAAMAYALKRVTTVGTAAGLNGTSTDMLAKTGTTDDALHVWLVAATTNVAGAYWAGNIEGSTSMRLIRPAHGITVALARTRVQHAMMTAAAKKYGGDPFPPVDPALMRGVQVTIPDLTGKTAAEASAILNGLGFTTADGGSRDSTQPAGVVAGTSPAAGEEAAKGSSVSVYLSNGTLTTVPNIVGMTVETAHRALADAGLLLQLSVASTPPNSVIGSLRPGVGSTVKRGTSVTVVVTAASGQSSNPSNSSPPG